MRLRLLSKEQRDALETTGLHDFARRKCRKPIASAAEAVGTVFEHDDEVHLESVQAVLVERLKLIGKLDARIKEEISLGSTTFATPDDFYQALAIWIVERQLEREELELNWVPSKHVRRRGRFWLWR